MGVRFPSQAGKVPLAGVTLVTNAETAFCTVGPFSPSLDGAQILFVWYATISTGVAATGLTVRLHRGVDTTGPIVQTSVSTLTIAPSTIININGCYFDLPGIVAGISYTLSVNQVAATGNGIVGDGVLLAFSL